MRGQCHAGLFLSKTAAFLRASDELQPTETQVSVGHNECVTNLVMNSPDYFYPEADK